MALAIHQIQGSYASSRPSWKRGIKLKKNLASFPTVKRTDISVWKHASFQCVVAPLIHESKWNSLKIPSFKCTIQSDEYRQNESNSVKNSVKASHVSHNSEEVLSGSLAVQNLFKSWVKWLHVRSPNQDETLEALSSNGTIRRVHKIQRGGILRMVWCKFLGLDATIKIPALIFIPVFLAVNMKYGAQVVKELGPLWVGGPLLVALYVKIVQVICSLYIFSYKQSLKVLENFHSGKMKDFMRVNVMEIRNLDYKKVSKKTWNDFQIWVGDKCLDYVESTWSCRQTAGFLKMVKVI